MPKFFILSETGPKILEGKRGSVAEVTEFVARQPKFIAKNHAALTLEELASITDYVPPEPPPVVPQMLTQAQVYLAFRAKGITTTALDAMIEAAIVAGIPEVAANAQGVPLREEARIRWMSGADVHHSNPLLAAVAAHLGYDTPEKLKAFFIASAQL